MTDDKIKSIAQALMDLDVYEWEIVKYCVDEAYRKHRLRDELGLAVAIRQGGEENDRR